MIIRKIAVTKTFPILTNGQWEKHYTEADIEPGDDIRQCRYKLKKEIEEFFFESKAAAEKQMGTHVVHLNGENPTLTTVAGLIKEINFCKDAETLERVYKYAVRNDEDLLAAYNKRLKQLQ